jgi:hypothetical protein
MTCCTGTRDFKPLFHARPFPPGKNKLPEFESYVGGGGGEEGELQLTRVFFFFF